MTSIGEDEVREALSKFVSEHFCYVSSAAKNLVINDIQMTSSFHYTLETFTERRETSWVVVPYDGVSYFTGPHNGPPPSAWNVQVSPAQDFAKQDVRVEIPNTSSIRICHKCSGMGRKTCSSCGRVGSSVCFNCAGSGRHQHHHVHHDTDSHGNRYRHVDHNSSVCMSCMGSGRSRCLNCSGTGTVNCSTCNTLGKLRYYIQLHVLWESHGEEFVSDATGLKEERIKRVEGTMIIDETQPRVFSLEGFPDRSVTDASRDILERHSKDFPFERIIKQRQAVKVVPIAVVYYRYQNDEGNFYVFGSETDRQVYFEKYPQRCCCLCSIM